ncbi:COG0154 Asp-tRNAAsn Glu-tRNAGln amidotransferase A subunit and related amidases [Vibrio sp. B1FLJ16]|uniref:amidase n=1 Tax=Vibrio sp. B1FLJ16 TaxID=2751178 RepID=UPI0015F7440E|nr:amidase [Vibrio sp. B1FLJ16]CAD7819482.1 COG0154 Asp-tRNAAsn Glu-tRNAGln amidotransferase A subunit and related amidases [Vibrio sp. B1FLJ16]CAE6938972.1 COG0154 Asp-tRNAAsn Glu-tRNAGln amidotransferase A subunit and related amidases [Vibrio sp. B1FLJ16]
MDVINKTAVELIADLRAFRISAVELMERTIAHARRVQVQFNPFSVTMYDEARAQARVADELLAEGLGGILCGLPITIKESQYLADTPCTNGSCSQVDFIPEQTSEAVQRLINAGAIIFAKTTCPEFSLSGTTRSELFGLTKNPRDDSRTSGGSSGGAGAAIAAGAGTLSFGGDGGGSIRIPAAFCGITGFKPTFDLIPREPCSPSWSTLVSYGPMTRNVADAKLMFDALTLQADSELHHPKSLLETKVIVSEDLGHLPIDDDVRHTFRTVIDTLIKSGVEVVYDHPQLPASVIAWVTSAYYDTWYYQSLKEQPLEGIEEETLRSFQFASTLTEEEYLAAEEHRNVILAAYQAMYERNGCQLFLSPTVGCEAFTHDRRYPKYLGSTKIELPWLDWAGFLYDANLCGFPALAMPMGYGNESLPLSLHITGLCGLDSQILNFAEQLEFLLALDSSPVYLPSTEEAE